VDNCCGKFIKSSVGPPYISQVYLKHNPPHTSMSSYNSQTITLCCCSVTKSCPTLKPHGLQHTRLSSLFTSGGQGIGASASASILPMNTRDWFPLELSGWISLQSKGLSRVFSGTTVQKHQFFSTQLSSYMTTGKTIALNMWTFVGKVMWTFKAWLIASLSYVSHFATTRPWSMLHDPWFMIHEGDYNS